MSLRSHLLLTVLPYTWALSLVRYAVSSFIDGVSKATHGIERLHLLYWLSLGSKYAAREWGSACGCAAVLLVYLVECLAGGGVVAVWTKAEGEVGDPVVFANLLAAGGRKHFLLIEVLCVGRFAVELGIRSDLKVGTLDLATQLFVVARGRGGNRVAAVVLLAAR